MKTLAIIGSGISGLSAAWFLRHDFDVQLFEADTRLGGHSHTLQLEEEGRRISVDSGFMVFNRVTYPNLVRLFEHLRVTPKPTDMSFSVQHRPLKLEYCGSSLNTLFAQRRNLVKPRFHRMLWQINRFNAEALEALQTGACDGQSLDDYVRVRGYGEDFLKLYLVPMSSAVWSTPPQQMLRFPARTLLRFFHNHGFLGMNTQHRWLTLEGGAITYVEKLASALSGRLHLGEPVLEVKPASEGRQWLRSSRGPQLFDGVIFACHPPTSLQILGRQATPEESKVLGPFRYQSNEVTLHQDDSMLPKRPLARASWNYDIAETPKGMPTPLPTLTETGVSTHYWMNRLQGVSSRNHYIVSVNGRERLRPGSILRRLEYEHPLFDRASVQSQELVQSLNRQALDGSHRFHIGAWQRYGFHEDGLLSSIELCRLLLKRDPWEAVL